NHTDCPLTDFGGKTSIFSHPVYLFLRKFSLQDSRGGSVALLQMTPFAWRAKPEVWQALAAKEVFDCQTDFNIHLWQRSY
ncbi:hypothetical protein QS554_07695, partial [Escherichia coli]|nr:hypothetical protein [Escherichia coli]